MGNKTQKKVAVIDDDKPTVSLIRKHLEERNYLVKTAYDGKDGLNLIRRELPDIIILDLRMPEMDGRDVLIEIKKTDDTKKIPVIVFTSEQEQFEEKIIMKLGAARYMTKPYEKYHLLKAIDDILS